MLHFSVHHLSLRSNSVQWTRSLGSFSFSEGRDWGVGGGKAAPFDRTSRVRGRVRSRSGFPMLKSAQKELVSCLVAPEGCDNSSVKMIEHALGAATTAWRVLDPERR